MTAPLSRVTRGLTCRARKWSMPSRAVGTSYRWPVRCGTLYRPTCMIWRTVTARAWTPEEAEGLRAAVARFGLAGRGHGLIPGPQSVVLGHLDREGPLAIADLAERAGVRHQSMRETVEAL